MTASGEPLDLGVVGGPESAAEPPERPRQSSNRWRWAGVALAFVAGGVLGLVVADTRDDAAGYADVRLVSGSVTNVTERADEESPGRLQLSVLNIGDHEVEILGLEPYGTTVVPGEEAAEPLAAPPGEWVTASQGGLVFDCEAEVGDVDGLRIRVRDAGGTERVVEADGMPEYGGVSDAWRYTCQPAELLFPEIAATVTGSAAESVTIEVRLSNPGTVPMEVSALETDTPGLAAAGPELPFELPPDESVTMPLTWTVTDCRLARQWPDPEIVYAHSGQQTSRDYHSMDAAAQAALVLLTDRVCPSAP
ncbi:hypothetical protein [Jiangella alkaliphila]|uniref:DUF4232 domain-containing protein n=1 Tax=Jiangella alkaliphila TaxID=419479 RepID=A0A1H2KQZ3_9ACTN|nr:hypothetical protein [Jiangella alkaliphila]SDU71042.1 hypothetical protein SAMN04488563_4141 [Jiangella alkaliphila]